VTFDGSIAQLTLQGELGAKYLIEVSNDLQNWGPLGAYSNLKGSITIQDPQATGTNVRFYRAVLE